MRSLSHRNIKSHFSSICIGHLNLLHTRSWGTRCTVRRGQSVSRLTYFLEWAGTLLLEVFRSVLVFKGSQLPALALTLAQARH